MQIEQVELHNSQLRVTLLTFGASIRSVEMPDKSGVLGPVHLSLDSLEQYLDPGLNPSLGASVGRYANRIAGARFLIDDEEVLLTPNEGGNQLHGGPKGFGRCNWDLWSHEASPAGGVAKFGFNSPDGDQGFPGNLSVVAEYELIDDTLRVTYSATTDAPTVVNLTNHGYWNLDGASTVHGHALAIRADRVLPVHANGLPAGPLTPVVNTPFDLRRRTSVRAALAALPTGFDHAYEIRGASDLGRASGLPGESVALCDAAVLDSEASGRWICFRTNQPAVQVYTGNGLGPPFQQHGAICLETQRFPDTPNHPELGSAALLPNEQYCSVTELQFGVGEPPELAGL